MLSHSEDLKLTAAFVDRAIADIAKLSNRQSVKTLDFGCGEGKLTAALPDLGYDSCGCDVFPSDKFSSSGRLRQIIKSPYRLPEAAFSAIVGIDFEGIQDEISRSTKRRRRFQWCYFLSFRERLTYRGPSVVLVEFVRM